VQANRKAKLIIKHHIQIVKTAADILQEKEGLEEGTNPTQRTTGS
jgi:hypothetical protein